MVLLRVAVIEPFNGGSHKQMVDLIASEYPTGQSASIDPEIECTIYSLPGKKWHWKLRTAAISFAQTLPSAESFDVILASSMLNLAELIALRRDWANVPYKVLYFHENQLEYPVLDKSNEKMERDFQFGYNQITSCLVADRIAFNSKHNLESFTNAIPSYLNKVPSVPINGRKVARTITNKSCVVPFPIKLATLNRQALRNTSVDFESSTGSRNDDAPLHIVWPHRWEHDKGPELLFRVLLRLAETGVAFHVSVVGERGSHIPSIFSDAKEVLASHLKHWGYLNSREEYLQVLASADVCVSTADHEFFGVAMLEACCLGCAIVAPNKLVYPEIYPKEWLFSTEQQMFKRLLKMCKAPKYVRRNADSDIRQEIVAKYDWDTTIKYQFEKLLRNNDVMEKRTLSPDTANQLDINVPSLGTARKLDSSVPSLDTVRKLDSSVPSFSTTPKFVPSSDTVRKLDTSVQTRSRRKIMYMISGFVAIYSLRQNW